MGVLTVGALLAVGAKLVIGLTSAVGITGGMNWFQKKKFKNKKSKAGGSYDYNLEGEESNYPYK